MNIKAIQYTKDLGEGRRPGQVGILPVRQAERLVDRGRAVYLDPETGQLLGDEPPER